MPAATTRKVTKNKEKAAHTTLQPEHTTIQPEYTTLQPEHTTLQPEDISWTTADRSVQSWIDEIKQESPKRREKLQRTVN